MLLNSVRAEPEVRVTPMDLDPQLDHWAERQKVQLVEQRSQWAERHSVRHPVGAARLGQATAAKARPADRTPATWAGAPARRGSAHQASMDIRRQTRVAALDRVQRDAQAQIVAVGYAAGVCYSAAGVPQRGQARIDPGHAEGPRGGAREDPAARLEVPEEDSRSSIEGACSLRPAVRHDVRHFEPALVRQVRRLLHSPKPSVDCLAGI